MALFSFMSKFMLNVPMALISFLSKFMINVSITPKTYLVTLTQEIKVSLPLFIKNGTRNNSSRSFLGRFSGALDPLEQNPWSLGNHWFAYGETIFMLWQSSICSSQNEVV